MLTNFTLFKEALITFNNKAYPSYNNVVILAGGSGSGKGFIMDKLVGIDGKIYDVDTLKFFALRSQTLKAKYPQLADMSISNPEDVTKLHQIIQAENIEGKLLQALKNGIIGIHSKENYKPNIIFDVTLSEISKLYHIAEYSDELNYPKQNRHLVWVIQDVEIASMLNAKRQRVLLDSLLRIKHANVAHTMDNILKLHADMSNYMDGDFWLVFNKPNVDVKIKENPKTHNFVIDDIFKMKIKSAGQPLNKESIPKEIIQKIRDYTKEQGLF